jgi:FlaG/FlaF family flagellin (archaellin)
VLFTLVTARNRWGCVPSVYCMFQNQDRSRAVVAMVAVVVVAAVVVVLAMPAVLAVPAVPAVLTVPAVCCMFNKQDRSRTCRIDPAHAGSIPHMQDRSWHTIILKYK